MNLESCREPSLGARGNPNTVLGNPVAPVTLCSSLRNLEKNFRQAWLG